MTLMRAAIIIWVVLVTQQTDASLLGTKCKTFEVKFEVKKESKPNVTQNPLPLHLQGWESSRNFDQCCLQGELGIWPISTN